MKVYIVSHAALPSGLANPPLVELAQQLSHIDVVESQAIPVIAIADTYNLAKLSERQPLLPDNEVAAFNADEFKAAPQKSMADNSRIDGHVLARKLEATQARWLAIDLCMHSPALASDLMRELGRYAFMSGSIMEKNLVILTPSFYVGYYARLANQRLNNLPVSELEALRSGQLDRLFMSTTMERFALSLPWLSVLIRRISNLLTTLSQRLARNT